MIAVVGTNPSQSARVSGPKFGVCKSTILPRFGQMNEVKKCGFNDDLNKEKTEIRPILFACLLNAFSRGIVVCHKKKLLLYEHRGQVQRLNAIATSGLLP